MDSGSQKAVAMAMEAFGRHLYSGLLLCRMRIVVSTVKATD